MCDGTPEGESSDHNLCNCAAHTKDVYASLGALSSVPHDPCKYRYFRTVLRFGCNMQLKVNPGPKGGAAGRLPTLCHAAIDARPVVVVVVAELG